MLRNRLPFAGLGFCLPLLASLLVAVAAAVAGASAAPGGKLQHAGGSFAAAKRAQARGFAAPAAVRLTRKRTNVAVARGTRAFGERPEWRRVPRPQPRRPEAPPAPRAPRTAKSLPGPPAGGAYRGRVGFTGSLVWYEEAEQLAWLRRLRETGVRWIREDFHWGAFEPDPGVWKW